jgi:hypothetical protein
MNTESTFNITGNSYAPDPTYAIKNSEKITKTETPINLITTVQPNPEFEDARKWYNALPDKSRLSIVITMYRLSLNVTHEKLASYINDEWQTKCNNLENEIQKLKIENDIYNKTQQDFREINTSNQIINQMKDFEVNLLNKFDGVHTSVNIMSSKLIPSASGKIGENYIDAILSNIPGSILINKTREKGCGDFVLVINNIKVMIESKNWTNTSIKGNPKEFNNFKKTAEEAKDHGEIDFAIMALHRVTDINGKSLDFETLNTSKGPLLLIYVTNLFNHPDRLLYSIDIGLMLYNQKVYQTIQRDNFLYNIDIFIKDLEESEESLKDQHTILKKFEALYKKHKDRITNMKNTMNNIINNTSRIPYKDRIIEQCIILIEKNGVTKVTKVKLEEICLENNIPAMYIRELGGIKEIKRICLEKINAKKDESDDVENESDNIENESDNVENESDNIENNDSESSCAFSVNKELIEENELSSTKKTFKL